MKEIIKVLLMVTIIVCYFGNLVFMFCYQPLPILIANVIIFVIMILVLLGIAFVEWLNN